MGEKFESQKSTGIILLKLSGPFLFVSGILVLAFLPLGPALSSMIFDIESFVGQTFIVFLVSLTFFIVGFLLFYEANKALEETNALT